MPTRSLGPKRDPYAGTVTNAYATTAMSTPPTQGLRTFLRGGYKTIPVPTVIFDAGHRQIGTWVPGIIDQDFTWSVTWTTEEPSWLKRGE